MCSKLCRKNDEKGMTWQGCQVQKQSEDFFLEMTSSSVQRNIQQLLLWTWALAAAAACAPAHVPLPRCPGGESEGYTLRRKLCPLKTLKRKKTFARS